MSTLTSARPHQPVRLKVTLLSLPPRTQAVLEYFFAGAGRSAFVPSAEPLADAAIFDHDNPESRRHWEAFHQASGRPGILLSVQAQDVPDTVWVQKPATPAALVGAAARLAGGELLRRAEPAVATSTMAAAEPRVARAAAAPAPAPAWAAAPAPATAAAAAQASVAGWPAATVPVWPAPAVAMPAPAAPTAPVPSAPVPPAPVPLDVASLASRLPAVARAEPPAPAAPEDTAPADAAPAGPAPADTAPADTAPAPAAAPAPSPDPAPALPTEAPAAPHPRVSLLDPLDERQIFGAVLQASAGNGRAEPTQALFSTQGTLLEVVCEALRVARKWQGLTLLDTPAGTLILDAPANRAYLGFDPALLDPMCQTPLAEPLRVQMLTPRDLARMKEEPGRLVVSEHADALVWRVAVLTSRGRLPLGTNTDVVLYLRRWPNITRLPHTPEALRLSALLAVRGASLLEAVRVLGLPQHYVFATYTALSSLDLVTTDGAHLKRRQRKGPKNRTLISRLFRWLSGKG